jgi:Xaa-Pro dipeptidase
MAGQPGVWRKRIAAEVNHMHESNVALWAIGNLREQMRRDGLGACLISTPMNVSYLSGVGIGGYIGLANDVAYLLLTESEATLVVAESTGVTSTDWLSVVPYQDYNIHRDIEPRGEALAALTSAIGKLRGAGRVGAEVRHLPAMAWQSLTACNGVTEVVDISSRLSGLRAIKHPAEVEAIERSVHTTDAMFEAVQQSIGAGNSEIDVYLVCSRVVATESHGMAMLSGDFVSGERSALIGGPPSPRRLHHGDLLIVDIFPRVGAYWADTTRTYSVGVPSQAVLDRHAVLEAALAAGEAAARPGVPCRDLYGVVKNVIAKAGFGDYFPHHAGHCVGLTPSEDPRIIPGSTAVLREGMVFTLEPGVYPPGEQGMRLEDNFVVTTDGCRSLSRFPRKLIVLEA